MSLIRVMATALTWYPGPFYPIPGHLRPVPEASSFISASSTSPGQHLLSSDTFRMRFPQPPLLSFPESPTGLSSLEQRHCCRHLHAGGLAQGSHDKFLISICRTNEGLKLTLLPSLTD